MEESSGSSLLVDRRGRVAKKLRISVIDRCNMSCLFCMPNRSNIRFIPKDEILSFDEITRITEILSSMGIKKIRITGGEPLLRENLELLVAKLSRIEGIDAIDMTTNGWFLAEKAKALRKAGLDGITISLHSIRPERFAKVAGVDALSRVLEGINAACDAGFHPVKINAVAIRGYNDDEIIDLVEFVKKRGLSIRFIEFMPLDGLGIWNYDRVLSGREILATISKHYKLLSKGRKSGDTATTYGFDDGQKGEVGLITPITEPFCDECDRIRLTADGKLLSCLFDTDYYDLKPFIRTSGTNLNTIMEKEDNNALAAYIAECITKKPAGIAYMMPNIKNFQKPRSMYAIGG